MALGVDNLGRLSGETDAQLLQFFATSGCEAAFCELVRRNSAMVRATAIRTCGDPAMAEEIAQNTLLVLARKARRIKVPESGSLGVWLHRVAVLEARNASKKEQRRKQTMHKISEGIRTKVHEAAEDPKWKRALPHLDRAIDSLAEKERQLIVMRFMEERPFREIGAALGGLSPDAVRMKTKRIVEKLSKFLNRRGAGVPTVMITAGLAALTSPKLSAAAASQQAGELLALAPQPSVTGALSFAGVIGAGWVARIGAFVVGLGIPVSYSSSDRDSHSPTFEANESKASLDKRRSPRNPPAAKARRVHTSSPTSLQRLLAQITQLENEFENPVLLAEALEAVMALDLEQLPIVWETAFAEHPPAVLLDSIVSRWTGGGVAVPGLTSSEPVRVPPKEFPNWRHVSPSPSRWITSAPDESG